MENLFETFNREVFVPAEQHWLQLVKQRLDADAEGWQQVFRQGIAPLSAGDVPLSVLAISLLYTSVAAGRPVFLAEGFPAEGEAPVACCCIPADWFFQEWEALQSGLLRDSAEVRRAVGAAHIDSLCGEGVKLLLLLLAPCLRYWLREDAAVLAPLPRLSEFRVFLGEYGGDCEQVYAEVLAVPLRPIAGAVLSCCHWTGMSYHDLTLADIALRQADFTDCRFEYCRFCGCDLRDAVFRACRFYDCLFTDCRIGGSLWEQVRFDRTVFRRLREDTPAGEVPSEFFRPAIGRACSFRRTCRPEAEAAPILWQQTDWG